MKMTIAINSLVEMEVGSDYEDRFPSHLIFLLYFRL